MNLYHKDTGKLVKVNNVVVLEGVPFYIKEWYHAYGGYNAEVVIETHDKAWQKHVGPETIGLEFRE